ncbi:hypothetical protein L1987_23309 [Smallanthus sonchifolius]|uniref:Uncharacterized protein n=1 Tax=Smallanthus sonchifolius TaxID=185202 RepID=A0ACB9IH34_9ASTR|nr:hypothetical protein L1987_23309 [Smallanthus sonchifolius]
MGECRKMAGIDGSRVEKVLESVHIAANKNTVPGDTSAMVPGMGIPALTSWGFLEDDFVKVAELFDAKLTLKIKAASAGGKLKVFGCVDFTTSNFDPTRIFHGWLMVIGRSTLFSHPPFHQTPPLSFLIPPT